MIVVERLNAGDVEAGVDAKQPRFSDAQLREFSEYIYHEVEDAITQRNQQESTWIQSLRDYEARPTQAVVNVPIEDAPNIVVPLCAIAAESIYSISVDLIFGTTPTLTIRSQDATTQKALQALVNKLSASPDVNFRAAVEHGILDDVMLGTAVFYVPWVEATKKTDINRVKYFGPRIYAVPPEDILTRGGSVDSIELLPWIGYRTYPTEHELLIKAKKLNLNLDGVVPVGSIDNVRTTREQMARASQSGVRMQKVYENYDLYGTYDIDEDGEAEDFLVFYDRTSHKLMRIQFNPYERRPFEKMCYQIRAHQFNGMGVPEMLRYLQDEISKIHNNRTLNMMLANNRMWVSKTGTFPTGHVRVWPNRNIEVSDTADVKELKLSDVYTSEPMAEAADMQLAERRVGSELPMPKPSQLMSSRTPATTTMSMLQQINRRFTPAFDQMRRAASGAMKQCLYRIQEQLLANNTDVQRWIVQLVGQQFGAAAIAVLADPRFDDEVTVELTASSVTVNRDVDKQEWLQLVDRLSIYYEKILQLASIALNPQTPPEVAMVAKQIAEKSAEVVDRVLRTFDSIRDPEQLIVRIDQEIDDSLEQKLQQEALMKLTGIMQMMSGGGQPGQPNGAMQPETEGGGEDVGETESEEPPIQ